MAAFSADAMGAQIGGVLSLWLGVTVMFAFEALEFLYVYRTNYCKKQLTEVRNISVAPAVETKSSVDVETQTGQISTASSAETNVSQSVVVQIE